MFVLFFVILQPYSQKADIIETFNQLLIDLGPWGMFISAFLAGSVLPFLSEIVMVSLLLAGALPLKILFAACVGNVLGAILCEFCSLLYNKVTY